MPESRSPFTIARDAAAAGLAAELATLPIYTVKNVMETSRQPLLPSALSVWRATGLRGFFRGWPWALARQATGTAARYGFYKEFEEFVAARVDGPAWALRFAAGAAAGVATAPLTHPLDTLTITGQRRAADPACPTIAARAAAEGRAFPFKGLPYAALRNVLVGALVFPLNETFRDLGAWREPAGPFGGFAAGSVRARRAAGEPPGLRQLPPALTPILTSLCATLIIQPVDFAKTRRSQNLPVFVGWNPRFYYRGLSMNLLRVVPHFVIVTAVIDALGAR